MGFGKGLIAVLAGDIVVEVEIRETRFEGFHLDGTRQFVHVEGKVPVKATGTHPVTLISVKPQTSSPPRALCSFPLFVLLVMVIVLLIFKQESEKLWWGQVRLDKRIGIVTVILTLNMIVVVAS